MADREDPNVVINRIEGHVNGMRTANPSGSETLHDHITRELANLRRAINGPTDAERAADDKKAQAESDQRAKQEADSISASNAGRPGSPKAPVT